MSELRTKESRNNELNTGSEGGRRRQGLQMEEYVSKSHQHEQDPRSETARCEPRHWGGTRRDELPHVKY